MSFTLIYLSRCSTLVQDKFQLHFGNQLVLYVNLKDGQFSVKLFHAPL